MDLSLAEDKGTRIGMQMDVRLGRGRLGRRRFFGEEIPSSQLQGQVRPEGAIRPQAPLDTQLTGRMRF